MIDYGLLIVAHLVGDFLLQNDWIARNKTKSSLVCALHVTIYTAVHAVFVEAGTGWPWWAYAAIAVPHFVIDRWRLAAWWMTNISRQRRFYERMGPWSCIVVDNSFHLLTSAVVFLTVA